MIEKKPVLGVLLGDSSGIGPEIVAKLVDRSEIYELANVVIIGDYRVFRMGQKIAGLSHPVTLTDQIDSVRFESGRPVFYDYPTISDEEVTLGIADMSFVFVDPFGHPLVTVTQASGAFQLIVISLADQASIWSR